MPGRTFLHYKHGFISTLWSFNNTRKGEKGPLTAPVSVRVGASVGARPPVVLPDFREPQESRLSGTLRFDSHREWRSLSPRLVSFHFRSVSVGTKTCLLILAAALRWYVQSCSELPFIPTAPNTTATQRGPRPPRAGSVHHADAITLKVCDHSHRKGFIATVISTLDVCFQCAPRV